MAIAQDAIDQAIASSPPPPAAAPAQFVFEMAPAGRPAALMVPPDITDQEWLSLINGLLQVAEKLRATRKPPSPLVIARGHVGR